jgi:hypothetical protein
VVKAKITAGLVKKEGQLTSIALIKAEAMQIQLILEERKEKSAVRTKGSDGNETILS